VSRKNKARVVRAASTAKKNKEFCDAVATALRSDFGNEPHAIKRIALLADTKPGTVKNWFSRRNAPSAFHLLRLARGSSSLLKFILEEIGGTDLREAFELLDKSKENAGPPARRLSDEKALRAENCTIRVSRPLAAARMLNQRQLWLLSQLEDDRKIRADDVVKTWDVSLRTARSDIAGLITMDLISFRGSKRYGFYRTARYI
jgi:hypothetical protein